MRHPSNFIDLAGKEYEYFSVIRQGNGRVTKGGNYKTTWICKCCCGKEFEVDAEKIRRGGVKSCGCKKYEHRDKFYEDLTNKRFDRLTVIRRLRPSEVKTKQYNWLCKCDCGNVIHATAYKLKTGHTRSCGCLKKEFSIGDKTRTHGKRNTRLYNIHASMKQRCYNKNSENYCYYGKLGVSICDEWKGENGFENFYNWAIKNGYNDELSIDRINPYGNYEPSNCRWADAITQARNKRNSYV